MGPPSDIAISVRGLSKAYTIAHNQERHITLAETLLARLKNPFKRTSKQTFWALKDVSFDVKKGECIGIIGCNGAGKSTLLKILSRITEPTKGAIDLYGRVGSLLEVGTGFHPELTGRENMFLNGAILGMTKSEIRKQFDAIVEFAGVEKFLDTPVKRYSSGMYVRLAFAVAAHLNPEILIVDEVLAVGDTDFQNKCLGKMKDVTSGGRTVVFVSHNMHAISILCSNVIVLQNGRVEYSGMVAEGISTYLRRPTESKSHKTAERRAGSGEYRFSYATPTREHFEPVDEKIIRFQLRRRGGRIGQMYLSALLVNASGVEIAQFDSRLTGFLFRDVDALEGELRMGHPWLKPGEYRIDLYICSTGTIVDRFDDACRFRVAETLPYEFGAPIDGTQYGLILPEFEWAATEGVNEPWSATFSQL